MNDASRAVRGVSHALSLRCVAVMRLNGENIRLRRTLLRRAAKTTTESRVGRCELDAIAGITAWTYTQTEHDDGSNGAVPPA